MRYQNLIESNPRKAALLETVCVGTTPDQRLVIEGLYNHFRPLIEATLSPSQIKDVFSDVERTVTDLGKNRTLAGKTVDAGTRAQELLSTAGKWLQDTAPVKFFDQKFEKLKSTITDKLGEDSAVIKSVDALGKFAKENPGKTAFVVGVLTAVASVSGGPGAGAIAGQILRGSVELLKGEKLSTAVGRGAKTGVIGYIAGLGAKGVAEMFSNLTLDVAKIPGYVSLRRVEMRYVVNGVTMFEFNSFIPAELQTRVRVLFNASVEEMRNGNFNRGANGLARLKEILTNAELQKVIDDALINNQTLYAQARDDIANTRKVIGQIVAGVQGATAAATSVDRTKPGNLSESQVLEIFSMSEGPLDALKGLAGKAAAKAAQIGKNITTKVTADKLEKLWNAAGRPIDSANIVKILRRGGISDDLIKGVLTKVGVDQNDIASDLGAGSPAAEVPFKSGVADIDAAAEKIFKEKGKDAFVAYWEKVVSDQTSTAVNRGTDPIGTVVNRTIKDPKTGKDVDVRLKKVGDNKWQNLNDPSSPPFTPKPGFAKSADLREMSSAGSTSSGSIASVASGLGGPMMPVIRRMPAGQSFFGPAGTAPTKTKKKRSKRQ
jgi:hypothetical protein